MSSRGVLRIQEGGRLAFWCPGCEEFHAVVVPGWTFNGNYDRPTFSPSILITSGHFARDWKGPDCWCTFRLKHPGLTSFECSCCHSWVKDGQIQFLNDCTHKLAGKTVPLELPPI